MHRQTLLAALVAMVVTVGCETSNQDYSNSARVVDVTARPQGVNTAVYTNTQTQASLKGRQVSSGTNGTAVEYATPNPQAMRSSNINLYDNTMVPMQGEVGAQAVAGTAQPLALDAGMGTTPTASPTPTALPPDSAVVGTTSGPQVTPATTLPAGADSYTVVHGDTLYSIAFRYGLDYRALAEQNGIAPPYNIAVGQTLQLHRQNAVAPTYTVQRGDTLYSIAKKQGQSVPFLAGVNDLDPPYNLTVGQVLYLARHDATTTANRPLQAQVPVAGQSSTVADASKSSSSAATGKQTNTDSSISTTTVLTKPVVVSGETRKVGGVTWMWPCKGSIIEGFSRSEQGNKGIDIAGNRGQQVLAAADGQVVYAGNALRGYGNLIIINHANEYLSAYAHNEVLQVKEGQSVKRGQQIARMGSTDAKTVRLHFEIRYRGQSVNPLSYLPK